jgi:hypothetical protein
MFPPGQAASGSSTAQALNSAMITITAFTYALIGPPSCLCGQIAGRRTALL